MINMVYKRSLVCFMLDYYGDCAEQIHFLSSGPCVQDQEYLRDQLLVLLLLLYLTHCHRPVHYHSSSNFSKDNCEKGTIIFGGERFVKPLKIFQAILLSLIVMFFSIAMTSPLIVFTKYEVKIDILLSQITQNCIEVSI